MDGAAPRRAAVRRAGTRGRSRVARQLEGLVPDRHRVVRSAGARAGEHLQLGAQLAVCREFLAAGLRRRPAARAADGSARRTSTRRGLRCRGCRFRRDRKCGWRRKRCAAPSARSTSLRSAAQQAAEVLKITTFAFEAGATTNLEVIDAQRQARDADSAAAVAEDAVRRAQLDLLTALGRFPQ